MGARKDPRAVSKGPGRCPWHPPFLDVSPRCARSSPQRPWGTPDIVSAGSQHVGKHHRRWVPSLPTFLTDSSPSPRGARLLLTAAGAGKTKVRHRSESLGLESCLAGCMTCHRHLTNSSSVNLEEFLPTGMTGKLHETIFVKKLGKSCPSSRNQ